MNTKSDTKARQNALGAKEDQNNEKLHTDFEHIVHSLDKDNSTTLLRAKPALAYMKESRTGKNLLQLAVEKGATTDCVNEICRINRYTIQEALLGQTAFQFILERDFISTVEAQYLKIMLQYEPGLAAGKYGEVSQETPLHKLLSFTKFSSELQEATLKVMALHPTACSSMAEGEYPLHRFLAAGANSLPVLLQALRTFPGATRVRPTQGRNKGSLPLHAAVINGLDFPVVRAVFQTYPGAVLQKMRAINTPPVSILDYALKNSVTQDIVELLALGSRPLDLKEREVGGGQLHEIDNPRNAAYARASLLGQFNREHSFNRSIAEDEDAIDKSTAMRRFRKRMCTVYVRPFHHQAVPFKLILDPNSTVEELKEEVYKVEGTPPELQHLEDEVGERLMNGDLVGNYADQNKYLMLTLLLAHETIHIAIRHIGHFEVLHTLLKIVPRAAQTKDAFGRLPLHIALESECEDALVQMLYDRHPKAATTACGKAGYPIELAVHRVSHESVVRRLLQKIHASDWTAQGYYRPDGDSQVTQKFPPLLHSMVEHGYRLELVQALLDTGYPVQVRDPATGTTGFEAAMIFGAPDVIINELKERHERVDPEFLSAVTPDGRTPVHIAAASGVSVHTLDMLIASGGYSLFQARDGNGQLPLHIAATYQLSHDAVREMALAFPEAVSHKDSLGRTPLHLAIKHKAPPGVVFEMGRHLTDATKLRDKQNRSLLMMAVQYDSPLHIIHELLELCPELVNHVNFVSGEWPSNQAGQEVKRLAMEPRTKANGQGVKPAWMMNHQGSGLFSSEQGAHHPGTPSTALPARGTPISQQAAQRGGKHSAAPVPQVQPDSPCSSTGSAEFCPTM